MTHQCIYLAVLCLLHAVACDSQTLESKVAVTQLAQGDDQGSETTLNYDFTMKGKIDHFGFNTDKEIPSHKTDGVLNGTFTISFINGTVKTYQNLTIDGQLTARNVSKKNSTLFEVDGKVTVHEIHLYGPLEIRGEARVENATENGYTLIGSIYATGAFIEEKTCVRLNGTLHVNVNGTMIIDGSLNYEIRTSIMTLVKATCGIVGALVACHLAVVVGKYGSLDGVRASCARRFWARPRDSLAHDRGDGTVASLSYSAKREEVALS